MISNNSTHKSVLWRGWLYFASFMLMISGAFELVAGLTALFQNTVYVTANTHLVALDLTQWGFVHLILGVVLLVSGLALLAGKLWGRIVGVIMASLSAIANFAFIDAYPWWSIAVIAVDIVTIYAIMVHGGELEER